VRARPPALVVTDIRIPRTDGVAVMREVARLGSDIPVIAISGHFDSKASVGRDEARALGAALTLTKPFKRLELIEAVLLLAGKPDS
jgi:FixJ family two-component response regulator